MKTHGLEDGDGCQQPVLETNYHPLQVVVSKEQLVFFFFFYGVLYLDIPAKSIA